MSMGGGGRAKEPKSAKELRQRQLIDLADLDEEENKRIKALFRARQGGRAFRAPTAARAAGNSAGSGGGGAAPSRGGASLIPSSGFTGVRGGGGGRAGASQR